MIQLRLSVAAKAMRGELHGNDIAFKGVSTDTRTIQPGELFVALRGERHDAHDYLNEAAGAVALVVSRPVGTALPYILVDDTRLALGRLAHHWRMQHQIPVIAVTGSNGKTTTKEMMAAILNTVAPTLATRGNLNNDIGVPLTLMRLGAEHRYAVIEMGANHAGEIAYTSGLARADVAVITNAAAAHLEGFGSLDGVARAKGEIYQSLGAAGVAVINADDRYVAYWRGVVGERRRIMFGFGAEADVRTSAESVRVHIGDSLQTRFVMTTPRGDIDVQLPLCGKHNVINALAATAATLTLGVAPADIARGLGGMQPVPGRLNLKHGPRGMRVIDDTYNANPDSLAAALEVLAQAPGEKVLALGDMGELGANEAELHARAGAQARELGIARLYATGELSKHAVAAFGAGARHCGTHEELVATLAAEMPDGATVLVKGSRRSRMERVVEGLTGEGRSGHA